ncbi:hypothetical protein AAE02nite_44980 [Adhaeribacter aerolatus]|uniref:Uncharacterized protein n=1 Tax=Adhaeribacter aerolatus TaxID=670289 RepID=A0A512B4D5_9BACT|nr:hypothetical protein [Adhaeribacter aerolatus]GEO06834.1 hypothetical protein AAE02nite_44980 [Adhaeribacter aerolatus]
MIALLRILNKVVVQQFYQLNAGFFLVVFFLSFGIQQSPTMLVSPYFLTGAVTSPVFIFSVLGVFLLYYLKCFNFLLKTIRAPENEYLFITSLFPRRILWLGLALTHLQLFLPALVYTILISYYGLQTAYYWVIGVVTSYNLLLILYTLFYFGRQITQTIPEAADNIILRSGEKRILAHPVLWPLRYLVRQEKVMLGLTKILSLGVLYAFMTLYPYPKYDLRPTFIGFLTAVVTQAMLVQQVQQFQETALVFWRQLPFPRWHRFTYQIILFSLLLVPEIIMVLRLNFNPATISSLIFLVTFGISVISLIYTLLYLKLNQEAYLKWVFFIYIGLLLFLLLHPPLYLLTILLFLLAYSLYYRYYYVY